MELTVLLASGSWWTQFNPCLIAVWDLHHTSDSHCQKTCLRADEDTQKSAKRRVCRYELNPAFHPEAWLQSLVRWSSWTPVSFVIDWWRAQSTLETFGSTNHNYAGWLTKAVERGLWNFLSSLPDPSWVHACGPGAAFLTSWEKHRRQFGVKSISTAAEGTQLCCWWCPQWTVSAGPLVH